MNLLKIIFNKAMFTCHRSTALQSEFIKIISSTNFNFKVCACYFSLFLKEHVFPGYFERNTLKRNLTYSCFIFPLFHEHLFSPELPHATCLLETSCLEKITVCVIETMLVTLPLVQMNKARREVSQQIKYKSTQDKIATVLRTYLND